MINDAIEGESPPVHAETLEHKDVQICLGKTGILPDNRAWVESSLKSPSWFLLRLALD
jgi:hypothetical protein